MKTICVINYKGGVGKTTITANLAAEMAFRGNKILAIDLDPQASLTFSFISIDEWHKSFEATKTIKKWYDAFIDRDTDLNLFQLIGTPEKANVNIKNGRLDLICSHLALINVDLELAARLSGSNERDLRNNYLRVHSRLRQGLATLKDGDYDYVLIDCPPNFNIVTKTAVVASDYLIAPTKADYLSTLGIDYVKKHLDVMSQLYNKYASEMNDVSFLPIAPSILGVLFTMVQMWKQQPISAQQQYIEQVRRAGKVPVFDTFIRENKTVYADAPEHGVPVVIKKGSGQTYEEVRKELHDLATEVLAKVGV